MKSWLERNGIEMYSTHKGKSVISERFITTYKYMISITKNLFIDKLDDIVNRYNNTYHSTIKMKPVDVKPNTYISSSKEINDKYPKSQIGDIVRISKYKNIFTINFTPNWSGEVFVKKYCVMDICYQHS